MPIEIVYTIEDRRRRRATTSVHIPDGQSETATTEFAAAWADAVDNLINGVIRLASAILKVDISGLTGNIAASSSDVEEIGSAQFRTADGLVVEVNIPSINETLINNDTGDVDQSLTAVQNFIAMMEDGLAVTGGTAEPSDVGGIDITSLIYFRERSRSSGTRKVG